MWKDRKSKVGVPHPSPCTLVTQLSTVEQDPSYLQHPLYCLAANGYNVSERKGWGRGELVFGKMKEMTCKRALNAESPDS